MAIPLPVNPPVFPATVSTGEIIRSTTYGNTVRDSLLGLWQDVQALATASGTVATVFGRMGDVTAAPGDYNVGQITGAVAEGRIIATGTGLQGGGDLSANRTLSVVDDTTTQRVRASSAGTFIAARREINFISGSNATVAVADDAGNNRLNVTISATGGGGGGGVTPTFQTNGVVAGTRDIVNFIAGTNVTLVGADDAGNSRVNITINATPGSGSPQTPWATDIDAANHRLTYVAAVETYAPGLSVNARWDGSQWVSIQAGNFSCRVESNGAEPFAVYTGPATGAAGTPIPMQKWMAFDGASLLSIIAGVTAQGVIYSTGGGFRFPDGSLQTTAAVTGSQTPWTSNINGAGFNLSGVGNISAAGNINAVGFNSSTMQTIGGQPTNGQILRASSEGYVMSGWINTLSGDAGTAPITRVYASPDNFIRYYTVANFSAQLTPAWANITGKPAIVLANGSVVSGQLVMSATTLGPGQAGSAIEIREVLQVANTQTDNAYSPRLAFHWANRAFAQIGIDGLGAIRTFNQLGNDYNSFACGQLNASGDVITTFGFQAINTVGAPGVLIGESLGAGGFCRLQWNNVDKTLEFSYSTGAKFVLSANHIRMFLPAAATGVPTGGLWRDASGFVRCV